MGVSGISASSTANLLLPLHWDAKDLKQFNQAQEDPHLREMALGLANIGGSLSSAPRGIFSSTAASKLLRTRPGRNLPRQDAGEGILLRGLSASARASMNWQSEGSLESGARWLLH